MEKERLFVPRGSKLYYAAVIVAIVSVVLKFLFNYLQYGTIAWEFTQKSIGIEGVGEMSAPILGATRIAAELMVPFGFILAHRRSLYGYLGIIFTLAPAIVTVCYVAIEAISDYFITIIVAPFLILFCFGSVLIPLVTTFICILLQRLSRKGIMKHSLVTALLSALCWLFSQYTYLVFYSIHISEAGLTEWVSAISTAIAAFLFYLSLDQSSDSHPAADKRHTGKLYIPNNSKLYYFAVILSIAAFVISIVYNIINHRAAVYEFRKGGVMWTVVGCLHLIANLAIPLGFILARKKVWLSSLGTLAGAVSITISIFADFIASSESIFLFFFVLPIALFLDATFYMVMATMLLFFVFGTVDHAKLRDKIAATAISMLGWLSLAITYHFFYTIHINIHPHPTILGAVAYFLPAAAAMVLGLAMKNAPAEHPAAPPQPSVQTP